VRKSCLRVAFLVSRSVEGMGARKGFFMESTVRDCRVCVVCHVSYIVEHTMAKEIFEVSTCSAKWPVPAVYKEIRLNKQLPLICKKRFVDRSNGALSNSPTSVICGLVKRHKL